MADKITLVTDDFTGPAMPDSFVRALRTYDSSLLVRWNYKKMRFVVTQCIAHHATGPQHDHLCATIYVLMVQDSEGCMMPLGDAVIDLIRSRDVTQHGYGPQDLARWIKDRSDEEVAIKARITRDQEDAVHHCTRDGRRQLLRAYNALSNCGTPNR